MTEKYHFDGIVSVTFPAGLKVVKSRLDGVVEGQLDELWHRASEYSINYKDLAEKALAEKMCGREARARRKKPPPAMPTTADIAKANAAHELDPELWKASSTLLTINWLLWPTPQASGALLIDCYGRHRKPVARSY